LDLISQLVRDEGEILHAYQDSLGFWTIGSGILIDVNGGGITHEENVYLLTNRVERAQTFIHTHFPWAASLDEVRLAVLENMTYNLGGRILQFKNTLALIEQGNYEKASEEMLQSVWAKQVGERAQRLSKQLKTGEWQ
jgi:lysozyme